MNLADLNFEVPKKLIAQQPASPRDHAKLLVYDRKNKTISDDKFYNVGKYLVPDTTIVVNNSRVMNCRYLFDGGKIEIFVLKTVNSRTVEAMVRPGKKFKVGQTVSLAFGLTCLVKGVDKNGLRLLEFNLPLTHSVFRRHAHVPLPPYIKQNDKLAKEYQTVYASSEGSAAAPTAGLHFTSALKTSLQKQFKWLEVTLHVGLGTFAPLKAENFATGKLHSEVYEVSTQVFKKLKAAPHITAVGTTSLRTLESVFAQTLPVLKSNTEIFIKPGYSFQRVNSLITNFHLPGTSLLLLVSAFLGSQDELSKIYQHAISNNYRFYSFGDCMLII